jgi:hypothetical protein
VCAVSVPGLGVIHSDIRKQQQQKRKTNKQKAKRNQQGE